MDKQSSKSSRETDSHQGCPPKYPYLYSICHSSTSQCNDQYKKHSERLSLGEKGRKEELGPYGMAQSMQT